MVAEATESYENPFADFLANIQEEVQNVPEEEFTLNITVRNYANLSKNVLGYIAKQVLERQDKDYNVIFTVNGISRS